MVTVDVVPYFSRLTLASAAEQVGLSLTWAYNSKDRFSHEFNICLQP